MAKLPDTKLKTIEPGKICGLTEQIAKELAEYMTGKGFTTKADQYYHAITKNGEEPPNWCIQIDRQTDLDAAQKVLDDWNNGFSN